MAGNVDMLLDLAGPVLRGYLTDAVTIEILINPNNSCFIERHSQGMQEGEAPGFRDLDRFLSAVADVVGAEWRASAPSMHAALPEVGWRIEAARPPQAPGLTMALRKHPMQAYTLQEYLDTGILTERQGEILKQAIVTRKRLVISGATGSAKTSLGNALLGEIADTRDRLVILEDDPELMTTARNAMFLRTLPGQSMAELVMKTLRYRPDRLIVGEVRDGAALAMCRAFCTGHSGMTTVHADSAEGTLMRLEQLIAEASVSPQRELIGKAIDLVAHMARHGRSWRCTAIIAVHGYESGRYNMEKVA